MNKPLNVKDHWHVFPTGQSLAEERNRYDVCVLEDDKIVIWCVDRDILICYPQGSHIEDIRIEAQQMADLGQFKKL